MANQKSPIRSFFLSLRSFFLSGLLFILPFTLTIALFRFSFRLIKGWLEPIHNILPETLACIPHLEIILVVFFIILVGILLRAFILRPLITIVESIIFKIPLVRPVYSGLRQLVRAFSPQDTISFKQVVLIEFPRKGVYSVGFVTSEVPEQLKPHGDPKKYYCVFKPTTPNPTTGFFMFVPEDEVVIADLSHQEAMALIISGGIIQPDRFMKR